MTKFVGSIIILGAIAMMVNLTLPIAFYLSPRTERLQGLWDKDFGQVIEKNKKMEKLFANIRDYEFSFSDPQVSEEIGDLELPIELNQEGPLIMSIEVIRWIEKNRYGYILQHDVFDTTSGEPQKIFEFSRNYRIGFFW